MHLRNFLQTIHWAVLQFFYGNNWIWKVNGRLQFRKHHTLQCTKRSRVEVYVFWQETFEIVRFNYLEPDFYPSLTNIVESTKNRIQEWLNHSENCITVEVSWLTQKVEIHLPNERSGLAFFSTDLRSISVSNAGNEFGVMLGGKGPHKPENAYDIIRIHYLMIYTDLIE